MTNEKRKFYRNVIRFEILSEYPIESVSLEQLHNMTYDGDCSGRFLPDEINNEVCDGPRMAKLLLDQGSDPAFFQLTDTGEDLDD